MIPAIGLFFGSILSAQFSKKYSHIAGIKLGIAIAVVATLVMLVTILLHLSVMWSLFFPMVLIYFGLSFVTANASTLAMNHVTDKAHGSAVMNFLNVGLSTVVVLSLGFFATTKFLLPIVFMVMSIAVVAVFQWLRRE